MTAEHAEYYTSVEGYLAGERVSQQKHEYLAGVIYAMAGTSIGHDRIANNIVRELGNQLRGRRCEVFSSDVKVRIRSNGRVLLLSRRDSGLRWSRRQFALCRGTARHFRSHVA